MDNKRSIRRGRWHKPVRLHAPQTGIRHKRVDPDSGYCSGCGSPNWVQPMGRNESVVWDGVADLEAIGDVSSSHDSDAPDSQIDQPHCPNAHASCDSSLRTVFQRIALCSTPHATCVEVELVKT